MTTQKYKSLLVIIWALWAFHPCLAIDDVLRTAKRDAILAQITGAVRPKKQISLISFGAKGDGKKDCKQHNISGRTGCNTCINITFFKAERRCI